MNLVVPDPESMRALGGKLGRALLQMQAVPVVVALNGDLGAGKTTFAGGVLAGLGIPGPVRSPTYTLIEPYEVGNLMLYHLDLYRLSGPRDLEALGLRDLHVPGSTMLVEWAERGGLALPAADLTLQFSYADLVAPSGSTGSPRTVAITMGSEAGRALAARLAQ